MAEIGVEPINDSERDRFKHFLLRYDFAAGQDEIFNMYSSVPATTMFAAKQAGEIIGSGISYCMGNTGWIGAICVDASLRRKGIGRMLTDYAVDTLRSQGCSTILLRASRTGAIVYETLGFRRTGVYENFLPPPNGWSLSSGDTFQMSEISSLKERHVELESQISGENKGRYLLALPEGKGIETFDQGKLVGFAFPSIGDGFICAVSDEVYIEAMVSNISRGKPFKIRTLIGSRVNDYLHSLGYRSQDGAIRMALGKDPALKIRNIAGTISSSIG